MLTVKSIYQYMDRKDFRFGWIFVTNIMMLHCGCKKFCKFGRGAKLFVFWEQTNLLTVDARKLLVIKNATEEDVEKGEKKRRSCERASFGTG